LVRKKKGIGKGEDLNRIDRQSASILSTREVTSGFAVIFEFSQRQPDSLPKNSPLRMNNGNVNEEMASYLKREKREEEGDRKFKRKIFFFFKNIIINGKIILNLVGSW
jgi:hypothetical protein